MTKGSMMGAIKEKVLLIDDDAELVSMLQDSLEREGFEVATAHDGETGMHQALTGGHSIAVIDVMMQGTNGFDVLRQVRRESMLPVLMLTARGDDIDRIVGLELGADDYVPKPCSTRELTARIRAILKRSRRSGGSAALDELKIGALVMWPERRRAEWDGNLIDLTSTEFDLLEVLARNAGQVVSKQDLSDQAMGRSLARFDRSIDMHMCNIRQKLAAFQQDHSCIHTVVRKGYMLVKE